MNERGSLIESIAKEGGLYACARTEAKNSVPFQSPFLGSSQKRKTLWKKVRKKDPTCSISWRISTAPFGCIWRS